ncbi:CaiB/BaiF CoA transferase family protein [Diaphorobacter caeni]|uniref:CaiB/BaiF CoA transferase family protein n=1 Tax=Diaphorobacter caeni TaxID=2784387 RepID=UPI00188E9E79|nr:CaiB/BaiF CoA-transferase family protein [Diaphorobacter caeni]MBF5007651.1 CoA transferase [Diaphorobacter caeni]
MTRSALSGIKVLDLSRVLAGPWCTQMLADLGADVIKVERPVAGDDTRHWGPPFLRDDDGETTQQASYYTSCNRNKRSITIDMATPEGQRLIRQMAAEADVLVENFKVGGLKQYGLDYDSLKSVNPRLIYCSVTGFGQTGPYAERAGYDLMVQAMSGLMSITGHADGEPGGGPLKVGVAVIDVFTGLYAANAVQAALHARNVSGEGQHIDMALLDVAMAIQCNQASGYLASGKAPTRAGNLHPSLAPYQDFPSADGNVLLAIGNDGQFARFCAAVNHPEWSADERFASNSNRVKHRAALLELMKPVMMTRTTAEWVTLFEDKAVPCGPINTLAEAFDDPQVKARGLRIDLPRWGNGTTAAPDGVSTVPGVTNPIRMSGTPITYRNAPPSLGQHTDEVLREMGLTDADITRLKTEKIV